ncbi:MAG: histidine triad nucleotide-binding protein [Candidatus Margulisbacteria bacterium]|nr:histidine triad nucleotide-binding protein [Candidatus Margulisiibacteriota bacterium]
MGDCIFCKIINKEIPSKIVYEDEKILAFHDIDPKAPVHILVIPKKHISNNLSLSDKDYSVIGEMFKVMNKIAKDQGLDKTGFRIVNNTLKDAGQLVEHIHFHLLGGRKMSWPPG